MKSLASPSPRVISQTPNGRNSGYQTPPLAQCSGRPGGRWNALRCCCGRHYRNGNRMRINSSGLGIGMARLRYPYILGWLVSLRRCRPHAEGSYIQCLKSWTYLHYGSVNISSHLIGSLLLFTLPFGIYQELAPRYASADGADILVFATFLFWCRGLPRPFGSVGRATSPPFHDDHVGKTEKLTSIPDSTP